MKKISRNFGQSMIELVVAMSIFTMIGSAILVLVLNSFRMEDAGKENSKALFYAQEGIEATRAIRDNQWNTLKNAPLQNGLTHQNGFWEFSGASDSVEKFTRTITISAVSRDSLTGDIVNSGGVLDDETKKITSTVTWTSSDGKNNVTSLVSFLTRWQKPPRGGMLVYGDTSGTTVDLVRYKILDPDLGTWGPALTTADIDGATINKRLYAVQLYSSPTRNERVLISRHYNGTTQYIYAQVYNGSSWGNIQLLSQWNATTFLGVQNFSGTYLQNGDFMVVYSDNTTTPKFRVWNGAVWSGQVATRTSGGRPNYIVARSRPGTNEVMAAFFDQSSDTNTEYFNGGAYVVGSWTLHTEHAAAAPVNTKQLTDFEWSQDSSSPTKGVLVYASGANDKNIDAKIWTANGSGGGSWSAATQSTSQTSNLGALTLSARQGTFEFLGCDKDANAQPRIICHRISAAGATPAWTIPVNNTIVSAPPGSDTGIQRSYQVGYEALSGAVGLVVYSDVTTTPKLKKYTASTNTWDSSATSLNVLGGALETVSIIPEQDADDLMILLGDTNQDFYSVVWDGANNTVYTSPSGKAFSLHGVGGSLDEAFWYDFSWDAF